MCPLMHEETASSKKEYLVREVSVSRKKMNVLEQKVRPDCLFLRYPVRDRKTSEGCGIERKREEGLKTATGRQVYTGAGVLWTLVLQKVDLNYSGKDESAIIINEFVQINRVMKT